MENAPLPLSGECGYWLSCWFDFWGGIVTIVCQGKQESVTKIWEEAVPLPVNREAESKL